MTENNFKVNSAAVTDRGLSDKRPQNEDAFLEMGELGLFAVADGVGGAQAGDVASQMAVEILAEAFSNLKPNEDAEEMMKRALERANEAIFQMSRDLPQLATMATTVVALHLSGNIATIGHVGDSRLYLLDPVGDLYRKTDDHSVVEEEVRAGRMTVAQAAAHPSRNIISRALGADVAVDVELKTIMFEPNTTFLLCSDGITRHLGDFELRELLLSAESPAAICEKMRSICYERGAEDNLTAVIARVTDIVARAGDGAPEVLAADVEAAAALPARAAEMAMPESANILDLGYEVETRELEMPPIRNLPPIELEVAEGSETSVEAGTAEESAVEIGARTLDMPAVYFEEEVGAGKELQLSGESQDDLEAETAEAEKGPRSDELSFEGPFENEFVQERGWIGPSEPSAEFQLEDADGSIETPVDDGLALPAAAGEPRQPGFDLTQPEDAGVVSKILGWIFIFVIGAILGAGALYVFTTSQTAEKVEVPLPVKTGNIGLTDFEESRRGVDDDPEKYIRQYQSLPNKDVEDLFLLGRAHMIVGNYADAKLALTQAQSRLGEVNENNDTVIANDIAAYLAIITNAGVQKVFSDEMKKPDAAGAKTGGSNSGPVENSGQK